MKFPRDFICELAFVFVVGVLLIAALCMLGGCRSTRLPVADVAATATEKSASASDDAHRAALKAAAKRADVATGRTTRAEADAADAHAAALAKEAERLALAAAVVRAEAEQARIADEAAEAKKKAKASTDRLGWWVTAAGATMLVLAGIAGAVLWWLGLARYSAAAGIGLAAGGAIALSLGLVWAWLPWAAAGLLLILALIALVKFKAAGNIISDFADEAAHADPTRPEQIDTAKSAAAKLAMRLGLTKAVALLRGKSLRTAKKKAAEQLARVPVPT